MATVIGGGVTTYINVGSNDANGLGQQLANTISNGLQAAPPTYIRTNGPAPTGALGVLTVSTPNSTTYEQPGVTVALVNGNNAAVANDSVIVASSGGTGQALLGDNENITFFTANGAGTVVAGDGNDIIGTPRTGNANFNITTGNGNDTIIAATGTNTVHAGGGANYIFTGNANDTVYSSGSNDVICGVGSSAGTTDTVYQTGGPVLVGSFAKNLVFIGDSSTATIVGGSGSDTITGGTGALVAAGGTAGNNVISGGTGSVGSTLFGGGNGDVLTALGSGTNLLVAGAGNETLTGANSTGNNYFFASQASHAVMTGGPGNDVYFVGAGASTVNGGSGGSDIVAIVDGRAGGTVVLNNFQAGAQTIELQGYGANELTNDLANQEAVNGSAVITLSDNTTITFTGIAHVNSNAFS